MACTRTGFHTDLAAGLHRFKQDFENNGNNDEQLLESVVFPFFFENALLPQKALTPSALRLPGVNGGPSYDHKFKLKTARSHSELLRDSKFLGILMKKLWVQLDSINLNDRFLSDSESLIHLLETEIQRIG